jgi:hypothetical protein
VSGIRQERRPSLEKRGWGTRALRYGSILNFSNSIHRRFIFSELKTLPWARKKTTIRFDGGVAYSEVPKIVEADE